MSGVNHVRIMGLKTIKKIRAYLLLYSPIYLTAYAASAFLNLLSTKLSTLWGQNIYEIGFVSNLTSILQDFFSSFRSCDSAVFSLLF